MKPSVTISDGAGRSITSRSAAAIAREVHRWITQPTGQQLELIQALQLELAGSRLYSAGRICDDLGLNFAYSY